MKMNLTSISFMALLTASSNAALIAGLTVESGTTNPFNPAVMGPAKAINGEGLPGDIPALSGTHGTSFDEQWWTFGGNTNNLADIVINLNGTYLLSAIQIWNYNEGGVTSRGIRNAEIYVSPDGNVSNLVKLTTNGVGSQDNGSGDFLLPQAPGNGGYLGFSLDLAGVTDPSLLDSVALVQVRALDGYSGDNSAGTGLAEIQFDGRVATVIPEPSSMFLTALGGLALLGIRRRS